MSNSEKETPKIVEDFIDISISLKHLKPIITDLKGDWGQIMRKLGLHISTSHFI